MEIYPLVYARLLLYTAVLGGAVGALCDLFRVLCAKLSKKGILRAIGDFLAVALASLGLIVLCYYFNRGAIRGFCVVGLLAGFFVYRHTLSHLICPLISLAFRVIFTVFAKIASPIVKFFIFLEKIFQKSKYYLAKALEKLCDWVYNIYIGRFIIKRARKGFLGKRRKERKE